MPRYVLVQDPCHDYAIRFIGDIHRKYGYRSICFYTDRQQRIRHAREFPLLRSECVAATYEVKPSHLDQFADDLRGRFEIAAVIPFNEPTVLAAAELAECLQLGWSQPRVLRRFRDKHAMKTRLLERDAGLRLNATRRVHSLREVLAARRDDRFRRFVLKPNDGYGNRGIGMFDEHSSDAHIEGYFSGTTAPMVMEEYIGGIEYFVNGQVDANGRSIIVAIFEYRRVPANGRQNIDLETRRVATTEPVFSQLCGYARRVIEASELRRSPFHLEVKVDAQGPCLIEVAARLPGLGNAFLCEQLHGGTLDLFDLAGHYYLEDSDYGEPPLDWRSYDSSAVRYVHGIAERRELIYRLTGVPQIEALPEFHSWAHKPSIGARVEKTVDSLSMPWSLVIRASDEAAADTAAGRARRLLAWNQPRSALGRLGVAVEHGTGRCLAALRMRLRSLIEPVGDVALLDGPGSATGMAAGANRLAARALHAAIRRWQLARFGKRRLAPMSTAIAPQQQAVADQAVRWALEYLAQPHAELGRKGPICPFVKHTVDIGGYAVTVHAAIDGADLPALRRVVLTEAARFLQHCPNVGSKGAFASLVMVFPGIPDHRHAVLDAMHEELKTPLMERDLMFSPFHKNSRKPSVSNSDFKVFRAPFAALVIRHMDVRDIAFLHSNRKAFRQFQAKYASLFAEGKVSDEFGYVRLYEQACLRFGAA